jgi:hypothetical protein
LSTILEGNNTVSKEELKRILADDKRAVATWINPMDNIIYRGETVDARGHVTPTYEEPIFDIHKYKIAEAKYKAGDLDQLDAALMPYIGHWADVANERFQYLEAKAKGHASVADAGVMTNAQYATQDTTTVHNRLFNTDIRGFSLPDAVLTIPTNGLETQIDVYTRFNISINVPEGVPAYSKRGALTTTSFDLVKDVGHIASTDEQVLKNRQNLWATGINNIATDFKRAMAVKIAAILAALSETNVGDWDAFTSGISDANPIGHIGTLMDTIDTANGTADVIVSTAAVWRAFVGNTHVRGAYNNQREGVSSNAKAITNFLFPGVTWYIDNAMSPTDSCIVMDREAVANVVGPSRVGQYRLEVEGIDGYTARRWYQCQTIQSGKGGELTSVNT